MHGQRGLALSSLLAWGTVVALVAILIIRVLPDVIDYYKIKQAIKVVAAEAGSKTVPELRQAYGKYAEVENIQTLRPTDLDIFKEDSQVVIAFTYERRIPLVANVSLLIDFRGSSTGRSYGQ